MTKIHDLYNVGSGSARINCNFKVSSTTKYRNNNIHKHRTTTFLISLSWSEDTVWVPNDQLVCFAYNSPLLYNKDSYKFISSLNDLKIDGKVLSLMNNLEEMWLVKLTKNLICELLWKTIVKSLFASSLKFSILVLYQFSLSCRRFGNEITGSEVGKK